MRKLRLLFWLVVVLAAVGFGLVLGSRFASVFGLGNPPQPINSAAILEQVKGLSQLVTVKYVLQKVVGREEPADSPLGQMFSGMNRVILIAHGVIKAGVDFERLTPGDLSVSDKRVSIRLPPAQILDAYLDDQQTQVVERTTGLFRPFDKQLEQTVRAMAVDDLRRAARAQGILKDADERAREQLKNLFQQLGFSEVEFLEPPPVKPQP
jgi:Protein of unknown function (DUF4230)